MPNESCCTAYCFAPVVWTRCTQFSGDFHFCDKCARQEGDFNEDDGSYFFWVKTDELLERRKAAKAKRKRK